MAALLFIANSAWSQRPGGPVNLQFEEINSITPWVIGQNQSHYFVSLDSSKPFNGKYSLAIRSTGTPNEDEFGNVLQTFDATSCRGKQVHLEAQVKTTAKSPNGAHLWLRVDRPNHETGFFSSSTDRPIQSSEWTKYQILGYVAPDATQIVIGCFLEGEGEVGLDDVSFTVLESGNFASDGLPEFLSIDPPDGNFTKVKVEDIWDVNPRPGEMIVLLKGGKGQMRAIGDYSWFEKKFHAR